MGRVLLIGGGSSVGKTTAATKVASWAQLPLVSVDQIREEVSPRPFAAEAVWDSPPSHLLDVLREDTQLLRGPITSAVESMRESGGVIEGEGIEPDLVTCLQRRSSVSVVYVIEVDGDRIRATLNARRQNGRFGSLSARQQQHVIEMNLLYGVWLRDEAERVGQAWVPSRPWASLARRLVAASGFEIDGTSAPNPAHRTSPPNAAGPNC